MEVCWGFYVIYDYLINGGAKGDDKKSILKEILVNEERETLL